MRFRDKHGRIVDGINNDGTLHLKDVDAPTPSTPFYHAVMEAKIPTDHHESDLYIPDTPASRELLEHYPEHKRNARRFQHTNKMMWLDIPFAYEPFWAKKVDELPAPALGEREIILTPKIKAKVLPPIPANSNPFHHDASNMGTRIARNVMVMHHTHDSQEAQYLIIVNDFQEAQYLIIVNTETGERVRIIFE